MENKIIHIAFVSSDLYASYAATTLISIFKNAAKDKSYQVHLLTEDMSDYSCKKLKKLGKKYGFDIDFKFLKDKDFEILQGMQYGAHVGRLATGRLLLADLYPEIDKMISVEADMFFRDDISKLWDIDLKENYTAAVEDLMQKLISKDLFDDENHVYFNTGVQIMNLSQMRKGNYKTLLKNAVETKGHLFKVPEQDIVNVAYENQILPLDIAWNFFHDYYPKTMIKRSGFIPLNESEYLKAKENPSVIHTPGPDKLWYHTVKHPYKKEFLKYFKQNPFYNKFKIIKYEKYKTRYGKYKGFRIANFEILSKLETFNRKIWKFLNLTVYENVSQNNLKKINLKGLCKRTYHIDGTKKLKLLCGLISSRKNIYEHKIRILGIPCYKKKKSVIENQINFLSSQIYSLAKQQSYINRKISNLKCQIEASYLHPEVFSQYKNAFCDKDVTLVCTGPTLSYYKPIKDALHIGVNGAIYIDNINLDYLFVQDNTALQEKNATLTFDAFKYDKNNCKKFFGIIPDDRLKAVNNNIERIPLAYTYDKNISQYILEDMSYNNIAYDLSYMPMGEFSGTVFSALQFILYAHPKRLYIVGWDCSAGYAYNKLNAIAPADYQINILLKHFVPFIKLHYPDIEIISINPVGLRGVFKDVYTQNYINDNINLKEQNITILENII